MLKLKLYVLSVLLVWCSVWLNFLVMLLLDRYVMWLIICVMCRLCFGFMLCV